MFTGEIDLSTAENNGKNEELPIISLSVEAKKKEVSAAINLMLTFYIIA